MVGLAKACLNYNNNNNACNMTCNLLGDSSSTDCDSLVSATMTSQNISYSYLLNGWKFSSVKTSSITFINGFRR